MAFDVERARHDTPGAARVAHLNNAGAALPPSVVTEAVIAHLRLEAEIGAYEAADAAHDQVEGVYPAIARLIGSQPTDIAVVENATRAWDMAFYSLSFKPGDRILTARAEYASNVIAFLQVAQRTGAVVEVVDDDEHGQFSIADLRNRLEHAAGNVKLIAMTHVPTQGGLVNPAEEVGAVARQAGVPFLLDACQSVGQFPVDVGRIGCDMLSATGRKFLRGPRGTGFLYVRRSMLERMDPPFLDLHAATWTGPSSYEIRGDARRFENWETNYAGKIGLGVAVEYALSWGLEAIDARVTALAQSLRESLQGIKGVTVHIRACGAAESSPSPWTASPPRRFSGTSRERESTPASPPSAPLGSTCRTGGCLISSGPPCITTTPMPNLTGSSARSRHSGRGVASCGLNGAGNRLTPKSQ